MLKDYDDPEWVDDYEYEEDDLTVNQRAKSFKENTNQVLVKETKKQNAKEAPVGQTNYKNTKNNQNKFKPKNNHMNRIENEEAKSRYNYNDKQIKGSNNNYYQGMNAERTKGNQDFRENYKDIHSNPYDRVYKGNDKHNHQQNSNKYYNDDKRVVNHQRYNNYMKKDDYGRSYIQNNNRDRYPEYHDVDNPKVSKIYNCESTQRKLDILKNFLMN